MHKDARGHFHGSPPHRCHGCTARHAVEDAAAKAGDKGPRRGVYYTAVPDPGMVAAMSDPVLTYDPQEQRTWVGASGLYYLPQSLVGDDPDEE